MGGGGYYRNSSYGMPTQGSVIEDPNESQYYNGYPSNNNYQSQQQQRMRQPLQPYQNGNSNYNSNSNYNHNQGYQNGNGNNSNSYPQQDSPTHPHSHIHTHQQSYETMTSGSDENSKSTNPSSLNSSYDHLHQMHMRKPDFYQQREQQGQYPQNGNQYGEDMQFAPVQQVKGYDQYGRQAPSQQQSGYGYGGPVGGGGGNAGPAPPPKMQEYIPNNPRQPIKLDTGTGPGAPVSLSKTNSNQGGKRQSWLKRKFSKKDRD
jgi:hypothetical protein